MYLKQHKCSDVCVIVLVNFCGIQENKRKIGKLLTLGMTYTTLIIKELHNDFWNKNTL